jgi:hypothetical protein
VIIFGKNSCFMTQLLLQIPDQTDVSFLLPLLRRLNISVFPSPPSGQSADELSRLHAIIDAGTDLSDDDSFLTDFEQSRQDRSLPFRD